MGSLPMGPAAIRRLVLLAAVVLLAPAWSPSATVAWAVETPDAAVVAPSPVGTAPGPAIRRAAAAGWWVYGARPHFGRSLATLAVVALFVLVRLVHWTRLDAVRSASSSLTRRRYAIALRAPPLPACT